MNSQTEPIAASSVSGCAAALLRLAGHNNAGTLFEESPRRSQADPAGSTHDQTGSAVEPAGP